MSEQLTALLPVAATLLAAVLLLFDLALSTALVASASLSRVSLRRLATESRKHWSFLERIHGPATADRTALEILRQAVHVTFLLAVLAAVGGSEPQWPRIIVTLLAAGLVLLVVEQIVARVLGLWNPRGVLRLTTPVLRASRYMVYPLIGPLHAVLRRIDPSRRLSSEEREEEREEEVEALIEVGEREGLLEGEEGEMMRSIVDLDETTVREIMTPRTDIVALPVQTPISEARRAFLKAGHSRLPVFRGSIDNVIGILHSRDLFQAWESGLETEPIDSYLREPTFVPETLSAALALSHIRQRTHVAIVVDEYGGVAGLVTLEDLLEEIVGDIREEHEDSEEPLRRDLDGSWIVSATTHVEEIEEALGLDLGPREFDTVGGLVVSSFGRVPVVGELVESRGLRLEVLQADRRRVHRVRIQPEAGETAHGAVKDAG